MDRAIFCRWAVAQRVALICVIAAAGSAAWAADSAPYGYEVEKNVMVPARDGVLLATDVYFPTKDKARLEGKLPAVLNRTPYDKSRSEDFGKYFATNGYVFVAQDTRGRFKSEGIWHLLTDDGPDGVDAGKWIVRQPWSSGKIGMVGTSYVGGTQHAMAMEPDSPLATVIPVDAMSNMGYASMRNGGAFELRFWNWIYIYTAKGSRQARDPAVAAILQQNADTRKDYLANLPLRRGTTPLKFVPEYEDWLVEAMKHGANSEFWKQNSIIDYPSKYKDMPVYLVGGWYDSWASNTTANFVTLTKQLKSPVYMIMGPWIHGMQHESSHGQVTFGTDAAIADQFAWRKEWMDRWLKGEENTVGKSAPFASKVRIFVMGTGDGKKVDKDKLNHGGYWRDEQEWPLARTKYTKYYLHPQGGLKTSAPESPAGSTSFVFDPKNPVPNVGGNISSGGDLMVMGAWDQRGGPHIWNFTQPIPLSSRNDILVFQSEPLAEDVEVTGEISVKLWISSSAVDTDFTAKLVDVYPQSADYPSGFDLIMGDGILRTRFRDSIKEEKLMKPGTVYPITIKLYPTSNVFKKGHRIRVDVSSSNFPRFDINPNTGEALNDNRRTVVATNTVHHDDEHPSHIVLPIIPIKK